MNDSSRDSMELKFIKCERETGEPLVISRCLFQLPLNSFLFYIQQFSKLRLFSCPLSPPPKVYEPNGYFNQMENKEEGEGEGGRGHQHWLLHQVEAAIATVKTKTRYQWLNTKAHHSCKI